MQRIVGCASAFGMHVHEESCRGRNQVSPLMRLTAPQRLSSGLAWRISAAHSFHPINAVRSAGMSSGTWSTNAATRGVLRRSGCESRYQVQQPGREDARNRRLRARQTDHALQIMFQRLHLAFQRGDRCLDAKDIVDQGLTRFRQAIACRMPP